MEDGLAKFRPSYRDRERVFQAVLHWEEENENHSRRGFVQEWIQGFELPDRHLRSVSAESELEQQLKAARTIRQFANAVVQYKMKNGVPEPEARLQAAAFVNRILEDVKKEGSSGSKWNS